MAIEHRHLSAVARFLDLVVGIRTTKSITWRCPCRGPTVVGGRIINMMSELAVWSWRSAKSEKLNFGDEMGPELLKRLGYRVKRTRLQEADIITAGSVLQSALKYGRDGLVVWGSGMINEKDEVRPRHFKYAAVRGRLTAEQVGLDSERIALGDPGILASYLWPKPRTRFQVGVVPHYVDKRRFNWADKVIDVTRPVDEVINDIASCATIVSSSLHGIIVAQSFGIPAMRISHERFQAEITNLPTTRAQWAWESLKLRKL